MVRKSGAVRNGKKSADGDPVKHTGNKKAATKERRWCPVCGYTVRGSKPCPVCGYPRPHKIKKGGARKRSKKKGKTKKTGKT